MRLSLLTAAVCLAVSVEAQHGDYPDYQDYQDYANYQDGYGQEDNLYADYADRQAQKAV